jgi:SAM-dependent methyltransferase
MESAKIANGNSHNSGKEKIVCRACGGQQIQYRGELREIRNYIELKTPGALYVCSDCGLLFRYPYLSKTELMQAYAELPSNGVWESAGLGIDKKMAKEFIEHNVLSGPILEVGCFRGDLLAGLSGNYSKYGIEPSVDASAIAGKKNIKILGRTTEDVLSGYSSYFKAIVLLDVIEHFLSPLAELKALDSLLAPGGYILISTGNTSALTWKMMRLDYWYYFPEHVCFFNPRWFNWASEHLALKVVSLKKYALNEGTAWQRLNHYVPCLVFSIAKKLEQLSFGRIAMGIYPLSRVGSWKEVPVPYHCRDHIFVVLRKD